MTMREYSKVAPQFWTRGSGKKLRGDLEAQVLALYFFTSPSASMIGVYYAPIVGISHETGMAIERIRATLPKLAALDVAHYDEETEMAWVPNMATYQVGESLEPGDKRRGGPIKAEVAKLGRHPFADAFWKKYGAAFGLGPRPSPASRNDQECIPGQNNEPECIPPQSATRTMAPNEPECIPAQSSLPGMHSRSNDQEQEQEQAQKQEQDLRARARPSPSGEARAAVPTEPPLAATPTADPVSSPGRGADRATTAAPGAATGPLVAPPTVYTPRGVERNEWNQWKGQWLDAYSTAVSSSLGSTWSLGPFADRDLFDCLHTHCVGTDRNPEKVPEWIRANAQAFVTHARRPGEKPEFWSSYQPNGFKKWLDAGNRAGMAVPGQPRTEVRETRKIVAESSHVGLGNVDAMIARLADIERPVDPESEDS
jgi:hypothetical protein